MSVSAAKRWFSFELFPPRSSADALKLDREREQLAALEPDFFSVTCGAGGSQVEGTRALVLRCHDAGSPVAPHLTYRGLAGADAGTLLDDYRQRGIDRIVALRGDRPADETGATGTPLRPAEELVRFIRARSGDHFHVDVACYPETHPESPSYEADLGYFKRKVEAGADGAITQYFYNADAYFRYVERCGQLGIAIPIVPGIMPITHYPSLARFSDRCGAELPRWLRRRLEGFGDDREAVGDFGADVVTALCERLLAGGAPGLHFYTLNRAAATCRIWNNLGLREG